MKTGLDVLEGPYVPIQKVRRTMRYTEAIAKDYLYTFTNILKFNFIKAILVLDVYSDTFYVEKVSESPVFDKNSILRGLCIVDESDESEVLINVTKCRELSDKKYDQTFRIEIKNMTKLLKIRLPDEKHDCIEICTGNSLLQIQCFATFAPLFPLAGKMNYMKLTVNYLALLIKYPKLCILLGFVSLVNLTWNEYFYVFDELLKLLVLNM
ncbi:hypothetical protein GLOIN_2v785153 [Rhizophagus clarus]|uniref:Uncharacterized protein n=1 Tax=Rhizophagus clarus TaxID=94130 RepID=A0A8H3QKA9_9GLOM|nr:hypothetical protein GLOIN_2v785153 [Rhizophagus clarus]